MGVLVTKQGVRLHPKQMQRHEARFTSFSQLTSSTTGGDFTAILAAAALTAGRNGTAVGNVESSDIDTEGWKTTTTSQRDVIIIDEATGAPPVDGLGDEIKGVLTFAASIFTITFSTFATVGVTIPAATYTYYVPYRFSFESIPVDSATIAERVLSQDVIGPVLFSVTELLTIAVINTIPDVATAPRVGSSFYLLVNGAWYHNLAVTEIVDFSGTSITWDEVAATFDVNPGDDVVAAYVV